VPLRTNWGLVPRQHQDSNAIPWLCHCWKYVLDGELIMIVNLNTHIIGRETEETPLATL
jgi:hypothetical protein